MVLTPLLRLRGDGGVMRFIRNDPTVKETRRNLRSNQTDAEKLLWSHLRNKQFCGLKFYRQYSIGKYILDFYCSKLRLAIELDGGQHAEENIKRHDNTRSEYLKEQEIKVIRFWNNDVMKNIEGVLHEIKEIVTPLTPLSPKRGNTEEISIKNKGQYPYYTSH